MTEPERRCPCCFGVVVDREYCSRECADTMDEYRKHMEYKTCEPQNIPSK